MERVACQAACTVVFIWLFFFVPLTLVLFGGFVGLLLFHPMLLIRHLFRVFPLGAGVLLHCNGTGRRWWDEAMRCWLSEAPLPPMLIILFDYLASFVDIFALCNVGNAALLWRSGDAVSETAKPCAAVRKNPPALSHVLWIQPYPAALAQPSPPFRHRRTEFQPLLHCCHFHIHPHH